MKISVPITALFIIVGSILVSGCGQPAGAADSVLAYLEALSSRDENRVVLSSCASWEEQAKTELEAFSAVTINLEDATCSESGADGDLTLVECSGKIVANYGNEILEIDLAERTYQSVNEGGEWRMCGYR